MRYQNKQIISKQPPSNVKPGKSYIRNGKILGFLALVIIPAMPLYMPIFCKRDIGWGCDYDELGLVFIPVYIAIILAVISVTLFVFGRRLNKNKS
jgi:hypothetical protein